MNQSLEEVLSSLAGEPFRYRITLISGDFVTGYIIDYDDEELWYSKSNRGDTINYLYLDKIISIEYSNKIYGDVVWGLEG